MWVSTLERHKTFFEDLVESPSATTTQLSRKLKAFEVPLGECFDVPRSDTESQNLWKKEREPSAGSQINSSFLKTNQYLNYDVKADYYIGYPIFIVICT